jgi:hypothetical protein
MTQGNLANALLTLGERESGTTSLVEAVSTYCAACNCGPASAFRCNGQQRRTTSATRSGRWASGRAGWRVWRRQPRPVAALEVYTREQMPLDWAMTQYNLGNALGALGERERGTARLEAAAAAFDACLTIIDTTAEWVPRARLRRDEIRAEIARREATK